MKNKTKRWVSAGPARLVTASLVLLSAACSQNQVAEPAAIIHEDAHSGGSIVAFSHAGSLLASGGKEGTLRLWAMPRGEPLRHWSSHTGSVNGIAFMEDDRYLITAGYDSRLVRHDLRGTEVSEVKKPSPITHMAADDASARILTGHADGRVRLWRPFVVRVKSCHFMQQCVLISVAMVWVHRLCRAYMRRPLLEVKLSRTITLERAVDRLVNVLTI